MLDMAEIARGREGCRMSDRSKRLPDSAGLSGHILPVSATLIGVCVTLVGLVKVVEIKLGSSRVDEYAALAAIAFLTCSIASYLSIRCATYWLEQAADVIFVAGLVAITMIATLFAYEVI
jgi:hypothetical protein